MAQRRSLLAAVSTSLLLATPALADPPSTGGASVPDRAALTKMGCGTQWQCSPGQRLVVRGKGLDGVDEIQFMGGRGRRDNRTVRPAVARPNKLTLVVPRSARSGPVRAETYAGAVKAPRALRIVRQAPASPADATDSSEGVFPIRGRHDMGQTATNGFGGGRGHQGQDMFAACGTPEVAVRDATVQFEGTDSRAGHYVVLQDATGRSYVYMHMRDRALVRKGDTVLAGQRVGLVGESGRATGCHLHFEMWTAPGWYTGGHAIDPLPQLKVWEAQEKQARR